MNRKIWVAAACALALGGSLPASAQGTVATNTVNVMNGLWGKHAGMRANHAKGIVTEGTFEATLTLPNSARRRSSPASPCR